jgi:hypothetical protein
VLVVDAANVVGSRPDGWWRDRAGAARKFIGRIDAALRSGVVTGPVTVVLEGRARAGGSDPRTDRLQVVLAPGSGDDAIVETVAAKRAEGQSVTVVTADRGLAERVRRLGAAVESPGRFLERLEGVAE